MCYKSPAARGGERGNGAAEGRRMCVNGICFELDDLELRGTGILRTSAKREGSNGKEETVLMLRVDLSLSPLFFLGGGGDFVVVVGGRRLIYRRYLVPMSKYDAKKGRRRREKQKGIGRSDGPHKNARCCEETLFFKVSFSNASGGDTRRQSQRFFKSGGANVRGREMARTN